MAAMRKELGPEEKKSLAPARINLRLSQLENPAIVECFDPESSGYHEPGTRGLLLEGLQQHQDLADAYHYAETVILPYIMKNSVEKVTPDQLLQWIDELHLRLARTLAPFQPNEVAGQYTQQPIFRYKRSNEDAYAFANGFVAIQRNPNVLYSVATTIGDETGHDPRKVLAFLTLMFELYFDPTIDIPASFVKYLPPERDLGRAPSVALNKIFLQYNRGRLSTEQKQIVDDFVKVCSMPDTYPMQMRKFAEVLLEKWAACPSRDLQAVAEVMRFAFHELTEIHAYSNGNGRLATCVSNIVARSRGFRSILFRYPGESKATSGLYHDAIAAINNDTGPLRKLILTRLQESEAKPYRNENVARILEKRVELMNIVLELERLLPDRVDIFKNICAEGGRLFHVEYKDVGFASMENHSLAELDKALVIAREKLRAVKPLPKYCPICFWKPTLEEEAESAVNLASFRM